MILINGGRRGPPSVAGSASGFTAETGFSLSIDGDVWTITDSQSRFGTKPGGAKALLVYNFGEDGALTPTADSRASGLTFNTADSVALIDTGGGHFNGAQNAAYYPADVGQNAFIKLQNQKWNEDRTTPEPYWYFRRRFNWTAAEADAVDDAWNWKHCRILSAADHAADPGNSALDGQDSTSNFRYQIAGDQTHFNSSGINLNDKLWHIEEHLVTDAWQAWQDGARGANFAHEWGGNFSHLEMFRAQTVNVSGAKCYLDRMILDDSPCQIFLTDGGVWTVDGSDQRELQAPLTWAAGEITAREYLGDLAKSGGNSVYVRLSDETVLKIGTFE